MKKIKKLLIMVCFILLSFFSNNCFAFSENVDWLQIDKKIYVNNNMAKFIEGSYYTRGVLEFKVLNHNGLFPKNVWYVRGLYLLDTLQEYIEGGVLVYYDINGSKIKQEKINKKLPIESYEKILVKYMSKTKKQYMIKLERELFNLSKY